MSNIVRSAARILDLVELLSQRPNGVSLVEAYTLLEIPKSSTLQLLRTLVSRDYATKDESGRYRINAELLINMFCNGMQRYTRLLTLAKPIMEELCRVLDETVLLGVLSGNQAVGIEQVVSQQIVRWEIELQKPFPLYNSAIGRILTAFSPEELWDDMLEASVRRKVTPFTATALPELRKILQAVRQNGVGFSEEEFSLGGTGIAAPIFAPDGSILAALNIGCITLRFPEKKEKIITHLTEASRLLTDQLAESRL